jgi:tetratricopeptide (TPR) repeat protein
MTATTRPWRAVAVLSCALGMACKESMVTAPVMVVLFDRAFLFDSFAEAWRSRRRLYAGLAATWLPLAALLATSPRPHSAGFTSGASAWVYLLNQPAAITRYLRQAVWPDRLVLLYGWPEPLTLAEVWPQAVIVLALLGLTIAAWRRSAKVGFLAGAFWLTLAPTSSFVPIATEVAAERRMYLPIISVLLLLVLGAAWLADALRRRVPAGGRAARLIPVTTAVILAMVSTALASATVVRNQEYASPVVMARTILDRHPTPIAHLSLGRALLDAGQRQEGLAHLRQALPGAPGAQFTLGLLLLEERKTDEAVAHLQAFVRGQRPFLADVIVARAALGEVFLQQERWHEATQQFRKILETLPGHPQASRRLGDALFYQAFWSDAIVQYRAYLKEQPSDADAWNNLGVALGSTAQIDEARAAFTRAVAMEPHNGQAHHNLAQVLLSDLEFEAARPHAEQAVALQAHDAGSHELLGRIFLRLGRLGEAEAQFARVLALNPASRFARDELVLLRQVRTKRSEARD